MTKPSLGSTMRLVRSAPNVLGFYDGALPAAPIKSGASRRRFRLGRETLSAMEPAGYAAALVSICLALSADEVIAILRGFSSSGMLRLRSTKSRPFFSVAPSTST